MKKKPNIGGQGNNLSRSLRTVLLVVVMFAAVSYSLGGCSDIQPSLARVLGGFTKSDAQLTGDAAREFQRFREAYGKYAVDGRERAQQLRHFSDAYRRIREHYVHDVTDGKLINAAIDGLEKLKGSPGKVRPAVASEAALDAMMASLDSHSSYLNPQEYKESRILTTGQFGGLGIEINMEDGLIKVISPIEDTPAYRAGIEAGDLVTHVDGDPIKGMTITQAVRRMRGKPGTDIRLTIRRGDVNTFEVTITRAIIRTRPVKWRVEGDIGVIRITSFSQRTEQGVEQAMAGIRRKLGRRLKGLVLDLRNNPGGLLNQSVAVADAFLQRGDIVSIRARNGDSRSFDSHRGDLANGLPIVVLINAGSASASEIVAGALQDQRRATVLGVRSFGKGSVQTILPLDWDGALRLTTALYYLPSGRSIQGLGVQPDIVISSKEQKNLRREENQPRALGTAPPLNGEAPPARKARARLEDKRCPAAMNTRTRVKDDLLMGCALMFLDAGSPESFLARIGSGKTL